MNNCKVIKKCLKRNKAKIKYIEGCKSEKSKEYNDDELFVLWEYYSRNTEAPTFCGPFDLTRKEYAYCMWKIYGMKSAKYFLKDTKHDKSWQEKSNKRMALELIWTYFRRGVYFLRDIPKPETPMQERYLDKYGCLNKTGKKLLKSILGKKYENPG